MKNFALIAAVAAIALPVSAQAGDASHDKKWYDGNTTLNIKVQEGDMFNAEPFIPAENQTMRVALVGGGELLLEGRAAYIVNENGNKYFANNAPHETTSGITYQTEDGVVLYATPSAKDYTIVADARDTDNDGYADDVDFVIQ